MKLGEWRELFAQRYQQYLDELAQVGVETAQRQFDAVDPIYGNGPVSVEATSVEPGKVSITAHGEDAPFIEFGAGVLTATMRPTVQADYPIAPGSWSEAHHGMFSEKGYWYYNGHRFYGAAPMGGMQEACNAMEQQSPNIARRVFQG